MEGMIEKLQQDSCIEQLHNLSKAYLIKNGIIPNDTLMIMFHFQLKHPSLIIQLLKLTKDKENNFVHF